MYCYNFTLKSHSKHLLVEHLTGVSSIGVNLAKRVNLNKYDIEVINMLGMCHDFGKATKYFQDKLISGKSHEFDKHGLISALFVYWLCKYKWGNCDLAIISYLLVKRHHGNLKNACDETMLTSDELVRVKAQVSDFSLPKSSVEELNIIYKEFNINVYDFITWVKAIKSTSLKIDYLMFTKKIKDNELNIYTKMHLYYSYLLSGDKMHLTTDNISAKLDLDLNLNIHKSYDDVIIGKVKSNMIKGILEKDPKQLNNKFFKMRQDISSELVDSLSLCKDKNIFSLHVPTGSGKTYLAFETAFKLAYESSKGSFDRQIFYCLPFTSIIDQNYKVLKSILTEKLGREPDDTELMSHHSLSEIEYSINGDDGNLINLEGYDAKFCMENWQSSIVVTTFVKIFNTLFKASRNNVGNRFHRLIGSVIILDELQCIEPKYFKVIESMLKFLIENYQIKVILVSATMPLLFDKEDKFELIPNKEKYFLSTNRISIENNSQMETPLELFKDIVRCDIDSNHDKSFLIVLNTVKSSREVFDYLRDCGRKVLYLSREIYPELRLEIIEKIRKSEDKYVVVSTQLVETGVDIDMDIVYRDFAPFDSIVQVCGRANRNGNNSTNKGVVKLFRLINDNGEQYSKYIYPASLLDLTNNLLKKYTVIEEKDLYILSETYFAGVRGRANLEDKHKDMLDMIQGLYLESFTKSFNLIENADFGYTDFIINIDEECNELINKLCSSTFIDRFELKNIFKKLKRYTISTKMTDKDFGTPKFTTIGKFNLFVIGKNSYSKARGVVRFKEVIEKN